MVALALQLPPSSERTNPSRSPAPLVGGDTLVIQGGVPLRGEVTVAGAKNEILPCLAATLLATEPVTLHNVPHLLDVHVMLDILAQLGSQVDWLAPGTVRITTAATPSSHVPVDDARRLRASILLMGPLLARTGHARLPLPGGDAIGQRRVDVHALGLEALGGVVALDEDGLRAHASRLVGADLFLDEPSVTGTENVLMAAVLARGTTVIRNAAAEPHVEALCTLLERMGARIWGAGTSTLRVEGVPSLGGAEHTVGGDLLEAGSLAAGALLTRGAVTLRGVDARHLPPLVRVLRRLGALADVDDEGALRVLTDGTPVIQPDLAGGIPRIDDGPWPAFPTDLMSVMLAAATRCDGPVLFFEKMYDGRMQFSEQLAGMGARLLLCDPHRVLVCGTSNLRGSRLRATDVRAGMALLLAALSADGESTLSQVHHVDRGYHRVEQTLASLGAQVRRVRT